MKNYFLNIFYKNLISKIFKPFLGLNVKPIHLELKPEEKCLVIAPHPDDESIGCGGILSIYPKNFEVISLTYGEENSSRALEFAKAMEQAKINNFKMLSMQDKHILNGYEIFSQIDISKYDYIFIPYIFDQHQDHKAVSILLNNLLKNISYKKNLKIAFYEVWATLNMPNYYIDISNVFERKKQMINCHKSQILTKNYTDKILGLNSYRGLLKNIDYAESFSIIDVKTFQKLVDELINDI